MNGVLWIIKIHIIQMLDQYMAPLSFVLCIFIADEATFFFAYFLLLKNNIFNCFQTGRERER